MNFKFINCSADHVLFLHLNFSNYIFTFASGGKLVGTDVKFLFRQFTKPVVLLNSHWLFPSSESETINLKQFMIIVAIHKI